MVRRIKVEESGEQFDDSTDEPDEHLPSLETLQHVDLPDPDSFLLTLSEVPTQFHHYKPPLSAHTPHPSLITQPLSTNITTSQQVSWDGLSAPNVTQNFPADAVVACGTKPRLSCPSIRNSIQRVKSQFKERLIPLPGLYFKGVVTS